MKFVYLSLSLLLLSVVVAEAQNTVSGTLSDNKSGEAVAGANIIVRESSVSGKILSFSSSYSEGHYSVSYKTDADSVALTVTGFNIGSQTKVVSTSVGKVDFFLSYEKLNIKEAKVEAKPVERIGDTLTYYMEMFKDESDRSIGDVLKKLPGIQVNNSGSISFNGKEINKFYVEGLDMLGGRYGIATNNIQASDISSVEVYENHEPVKMLQEWSTSDKAAINLRLKKGARGTWNGVFLLGGGYKPWQWNAEASLMYFGRKFQTISTYKSNNSGVDVSKELIPHYGGLDEVSSMLFVTSPSLPSVSEERYQDNNIHAVSTNFIKK